MRAVGKRRCVLVCFPKLIILFNKLQTNEQTFYCGASKFALDVITFLFLFADAVDERRKHKVEF